MSTTVTWIIVCGILFCIIVRQAKLVRELRRELRAQDGWWTCDACGTEFEPEVPNCGHECNLCHECLIQQRKDNQCPK